MMMRRVLFCLGLLALLVLGYPHAPAVDAGPLKKMYSHKPVSGRSGMAFRYPDGFVVGRFQSEEAHFQRTVVLAEPAVLGAISSEAVPVGQVPVIMVDYWPPGQQADFLRRLAARLPSSEKRWLPNGEQVKFPAYPAPYGDEAHFYLLLLPSGAVVEFSAHKFLADRSASPRARSGYDRVIERILPTFREIKAP